MRTPNCGLHEVASKASDSLQNKNSSTKKICICSIVCWSKQQQFLYYFQLWSSTISETSWERERERWWWFLLQAVLFSLSSFFGLQPCLLPQQQTAVEVVEMKDFQGATAPSVATAPTMPRQLHPRPKSWGHKHNCLAIILNHGLQKTVCSVPVRRVPFPGRSGPVLQRPNYQS